MNEEKLKLVEDWLGRPITEAERKIATDMLEMPASQFGGSYSVGFVARRLTMLEQAGKKPEQIKEKS